MDVILTAGQSNFANFYTPKDTTPPGINVNCRGIVPADPWRNAYDPQLTADGINSSVFPALGNLIMAYTQRPVGFISVAVSNSRISSWMSNGANYSRIRDALAISDSLPICFLFHNGETDSAFSLSQADYETGLKSMIDQIRMDAASQIPCGIAYATHPNDATGAGVRAAQMNIALTYPGCFPGADTDTLDNSYRVDTVHFNTTTGSQTHALLWFNALKAANIIQAYVPPPPPFDLPTSKSQGMIFTGGTIYR